MDIFLIDDQRGLGLGACNVHCALLYNLSHALVSALPNRE